MNQSSRKRCRCNGPHDRLAEHEHAYLFALLQSMPLGMGRPEYRMAEILGVSTRAITRCVFEAASHHDVPAIRYYLQTGYQKPDCPHPDCHEVPSLGEACRRSREKAK